METNNYSLPSTGRAQQTISPTQPRREKDSTKNLRIFYEVENVQQNISNINNPPPSVPIDLSSRVVAQKHNNFNINDNNSNSPATTTSSFSNFQVKSTSPSTSSFPPFANQLPSQSSFGTNALRTISAIPSSAQPPRAVFREPKSRPGASAPVMPPGLLGAYASALGPVASILLEEFLKMLSDNSNNDSGNNYFSENNGNNGDSLTSRIYSAVQEYYSTNKNYLPAVALAAKDFSQMYPRSLIGPALQGALQNNLPLVAFYYNVKIPLTVIALPHKDMDQMAARHRQLEITQFNYSFTQKVSLGGFGVHTPMGGPGVFNHVPPANGLIVVSEATSFKTQLGYNISLLRSATVSKYSQELAAFMSAKKFKNVDEYAAALAHFKMIPPLVNNNKEDLWNWLNDAEFARQRLAGMNPEMIARMTPHQWKTIYSRKLNWTPEAFARARSLLPGHVEISQAVEKGHVYFVDFTEIFDDQRLRDYAAASMRFVAAPVALFFWDDRSRQLMPLAIQLEPSTQLMLPSQEGGRDTPAWLLAKIWVNSMDGQYQELISHLLETHQIAEMFCVAIHRNFACNHPVYKLLCPHFDSTIEINRVAYSEMMGRDGSLNMTIACGSTGAGLIIRKLWPTWNFYQRSFKQNLVNRGLLNPEDDSIPEGDPLIGSYYWREDGLKLWNILYSFVKSVLDIYYTSDQDIMDDWELQNFVSELADPHYGNMKGATGTPGPMPDTWVVQTRSDLYTLCANIIFTVTAKHSSGNSGQYDYYGFVPNVPGAMYSSPVINEAQTTWETVIQALPPKDLALTQMSIVHLLSSGQGMEAPLLGKGDYPAEWKREVAQFQGKLTELSVSIQNREQGKPYPYTYLDPTRIGNSVYI